jgi:hypothetical protein
MTMDRRLQVLRDRASRALGDHKVADAVMKVRAIIGPHNIPASEHLAQAALDKLRAGNAPSFDELAALEIVVRLLRPVVFSRNGVLDDLPSAPQQNVYPEKLSQRWTHFRTRVAPFIASIGRIENRRGRHFGTGFLVTPELLATNRHVLGALSFGTDMLAPEAARVVFKQEADLPNDASDIVPVRGVHAVHPNLDMVLLSLERQDRPALPLSAAAADATFSVVAIGYPGDDPDNNPLFLPGVFQGKFGVKRAALGEVLDGTEMPTLFHDCSTTQGNSGSPVFLLDSAQVCGIHRSGYFMYRNEAVDARALRAFVDNL